MLQISSKQSEEHISSAHTVKVCFHLMRHFDGDVRARRAAYTLQRAGFQVTVVDISGQPYSDEEVCEGIIVKHMRVPSSFIRTRFKRGVLLRAIWIFASSTLFLIHNPSDVYHALDLPALPACYLVARLRRKPIIFESYELPLSTLPPRELSAGRRLLQFLLAPLLRHIIPRCDGVIAVSPPIIQEMSRRYPGARLTLVRNIPPYQVMVKSNLLHQRLGLDAHTRIVLYQGHLQADRELDRLVYVAKFLKPNVVLVLMGKSQPETLALLESLMSREGVTERVKILPPVPYADLLRWTCSADLGLLIYSPDYSLNIRLCLPNKLFEFLMAGLPILTAPLDAVAEIVQTYAVGQIVSSLAPEAIAAAIHAMLDDEQTLQQMRFNALQVAQQCFCWEKEQQNLLDLYANIKVE